MRWVMVVGLLGVAALLAPAADAPKSSTKTLNDWRDDLEKADRPDLRRSAAFALGQIGADAGVAVERLTDHARNDKDPAVREMAARAVGDIATGIRLVRKPEREWGVAGKALEAALTDGDWRVKRSAAYALGAFRDLAAPSIPALRVALRDEASAVRRNAAWAVGKIGDPGEETVRELCSLLGDRSPLVRRLTAGALAEVAEKREKKEKKSPEVAGALVKMLKKEDDDVVCRTGLEALAKVADETTRKYAGDLDRFLESKDAETVRMTALVLAKMGGEPAKRAIPALRKALADPDPRLQAIAASSLSQAGAAAAFAVEALAETLGRSKDLLVRRTCVVALGRINLALNEERSPRIDRTAPVSLAALTKALEVRPADADESFVARGKEQVRADAIEAIAYLGYPNNEKAFPLLAEILRKEENQDIRMRCVWVLGTCGELGRNEVARKALVGVLDETSPTTVNVRYNAARYVARALRDKSPDRTTRVLLDMLGDTDLKVRNGSETAVEGLGGEGKVGDTRVTMRWGGDARYMAAEALGKIGTKLKGDAKVEKALEAAAKDPDPNLSKEAKKALDEIRK